MEIEIPDKKKYNVCCCNECPMSMCRDGIGSACEWFCRHDDVREGNGGNPEYIGASLDKNWKCGIPEWCPFKRMEHSVGETGDGCNETEVDLEQEIKSSLFNLCELGCYMQSLLDNPEDYEGFATPWPQEVEKELEDFARHFYELGLKARK